MLKARTGCSGFTAEEQARLLRPTPQPNPRGCCNPYLTDARKNENGPKILPAVSRSVSHPVHYCNLAATDNLGGEAAMEVAKKSDRELLSLVYGLFNVRDIDGVFNWMSPDVDWPNAMEGGRVHGHDEVRAYWKRQWAVVDPHVQPIGLETDAEKRTVV